MEEIKENYISRYKIKTKKIKLIDELKISKNKTAIKYAIKILSELLGEE